MYPCNPYSRQAPGLYTYYAIMSLVVVILAISLIWNPFVQLVTEVMCIVTKVLLYASRELLENFGGCFLTSMDEFLCSKFALLIISVCCLVFIIYLASGDFLLFTASYVCSWPNRWYLENLKRFILTMVQFLLQFTRVRKSQTFLANMSMNYSHERSAHQSLSEMSIRPEWFNESDQKSVTELTAMFNGRKSINN